jgi:hypothetical protein
MPRKNKKWKSEYMREWYLAHREEQILHMRELRKQLRDETFTAYGGYVCACCGETNPGFLSLDHIDNNGNAHRRAIKRKSGVGFQYWLKKNGFPPGIQILCYNCNLGRAFAGGGICPHKLQGDIPFMKANPLGELKMELVHDSSTISGGSMKGDDVFRNQVPVKDGLAGQDTFKMTESTPTKRAKVELDRMHIDSGADLRGADMPNDPTHKGASDFTADKTA